MKNTLRHIIFRLLKIKDKVWGSQRKEKIPYIQRKKDENYSRLLIKNFIIWEKIKWHLKSFEREKKPGNIEFYSLGHVFIHSVVSNSFATQWSVVWQAPLSMGFFSDKNIGVGCHFLFLGNLPDPGIKPKSPTLAGDSSSVHHQWSPIQWIYLTKMKIKNFSEKQILRKFITSIFPL